MNDGMYCYLTCAFAAGIAKALNKHSITSKRKWLIVDVFIGFK